MLSYDDLAVFLQKAKSEVKAQEAKYNSGTKQLKESIASAMEQTSSTSTRPISSRSARKEQSTKTSEVTPGTPGRTDAISQTDPLLTKHPSTKSASKLSPVEKDRTSTPKK